MSKKGKRVLDTIMEWIINKINKVLISLDISPLFVQKKNIKTVESKEKNEKPE